MLKDLKNIFAERFSLGPDLSYMHNLSLDLPAQSET